MLSMRPEWNPVGGPSWAQPKGSATSEADKMIKPYSYNSYFVRFLSVSCENPQIHIALWCRLQGCGRDGCDDHILSGPFHWQASCALRKELPIYLSILMFPDAGNNLFYALSRLTIRHVIPGVLPKGDCGIIFSVRYPRSSYFHNTPKRDPAQVLAAYLNVLNFLGFRGAES